MSLAGRFLRRLTGRPDHAAAVHGPGYIDLDRELPFLQEQVRAYASTVPVRVTGPSLLDNFTAETVEMRQQYRRAAFAEPAVKTALFGKIAAVQALGLQVKPYDDTPLDQQVAAWVRHALTGARGGLPELIFAILAPGLIDAFSVCEKVWRREHRGRWAGKVGLQKLKAKDTRYIQFEIDPYRNVTSVISMRGNSGQRFSPSDFVLFNYLSLFESPFGVSDLRASYRAAEMIPALLRLRMIFLDKYSGPFLHGKVRDPALVEQMKAALAQARSGGFVVTSPEDEVAAIELAMRGTGEFLQALKDLREEIATGISGAFLHMMTGDGGSGQRGNSQVQQDTVDLFIWLLAVRVAACLNEQLVPDLVDMNFGSNVGLPTVSLEAPNPEHVVAELQIDRELFEMGVPLDRDDLYERSGRKPPKDPSKALVKTAGPDPLGPPAGPGGGPPPGPFGRPGGPPDRRPPGPPKPPRPGGPAAFAEWDEGAHPRGDGGRFAHAARALRDAHPHPGDEPPRPVGAARRDWLAADPALRDAVGRSRQHAAAAQRHRVAGVVHDMLADRQRLVALPAASHSPANRRARAVRAVGDASAALADHETLTHAAFRSHHEAVAGSHPEGGQALEAARAEAKRRYEAALGHAERHVEGLEGTDRERGRKALEKVRRRAGPAAFAEWDESKHKRRDDGKFGSGPGDPPAQAPAPPAAGGPGGGPSADEAAAHVAGELAHTGLGHRLALAAGRAYLKVYPVAVRVASLVHEYHADVLDTAEDYARINFARYTGTGTSAHDPVMQHLGVPSTFAAAVISRAAGYIAKAVAGRRASKHAEGPDPADLVLELLAAYHAAAGVPDEPLPSREEVEEKLAGRRKAQFSEWEESKHPRAADGKFGSGGGGHWAAGGDTPLARAREALRLTESPEELWPADGDRSIGRIAHHRTIAADAEAELGKLSQAELHKTLSEAGLEGVKKGDSKAAMLKRLRDRLTAAVRARERAEV